MPDNSKSTEPESLSNAVLSEAGKAVGAAIGGPLGAAAVSIGSRLGKVIISYTLDGIHDLSATNNSQLQAVQAKDSRTFVVIGLGRCGCRVTARLAAMIADAKGVRNPVEPKKPASYVSYLSNLLRRPKPKETLRLEPIMVIGDLNEATFADVDNLIGSEGNRREVGENIMRIDYQPLAPNGCGNVPIFGEFFTRGLLALPPKDKDGINPWATARTYLLSWCSRDDTNTRLAFYIFGAAGGSGAGAAAELMRAQRFAVTNRKDEADPQIYFTGIAVIPDEKNLNDFQLRNTGRLLVQYLADLNIRLVNPEDYDDEHPFQFGTYMVVEKAISEKKRTRDLHPWDSLGIVSNEVMRLFSDATDVDYASAEGRANQYIAQQVFNLAAAQSPPKAFKPPDSDKIEQSQVTFKAVHLDTEDLRNGLRGPFACAFSVATKDEASSSAGIDAMLLRAIDVPKVVDETKRPGLLPLVEGISISPQQREKFQAKMASIWKKQSEVAKNEGALCKADFEELSGVKLFLRCPRIIFVLTSPIDKDLALKMCNRIAEILTWLLPNLKQARYAIIPGTTANFSLSVYLESSVVLCWDVEKAIMNYIKSSWRTRADLETDFQNKFYGFLDQDGPIKDEDVVDWLGTSERYGSNVPAFTTTVQEHDARWQQFVDQAEVSEARKVILRQHQVANCMLNPREIASALRFLNYVSHVSKQKIVEPRE